jgi:hypothetical protein
MFDRILLLVGYVMIRLHLRVKAMRRANKLTRDSPDTKSLLAHPEITCVSDQMFDSETWTHAPPDGL